MHSSSSQLYLIGQRSIPVTGWWIPRPSCLMADKGDSWGYCWFNHSAMRLMILDPSSPQAFFAPSWSYKMTVSGEKKYHFCTYLAEELLDIVRLTFINLLLEVRNKFCQFFECSCTSGITKKMVSGINQWTCMWLDVTQHGSMLNWSTEIKLVVPSFHLHDFILF